MAGVVLAWTLKINGVDVPFTGFEYSNGSNSIGATLKIDLADVTLVPVTGQSVEFALGVTDGSGTSKRTYVANGRINGQQAQIQVKGDKLIIESLDSDKFQIGRRSSELLYDPDRVQISETTANGEHGVYDEDGNSIPLVYTSKPS